MPTLVRDPQPAEFEALLERRRGLGQDLLDEVWEGVYHMNRAPHRRHAHVAQQIAVLLDGPAREAAARSSIAARRTWPSASAGPGSRRIRAMYIEHFAVIVDDYDEAITFFVEPRDEPYGRVAVFLDVAGNRWDLLGPRPQGADAPTPSAPAERTERPRP